MEQVIRKSGIDKKKIIGAGIGMPGFIDFKKGINYSFLETKDKTITQYLSEKINLPVYIDNDSSLIALAELRFGTGRHKKNAMVINIGWGVGLGMVLNGELFRGHNGFAGEFSHMPLFNNNKLCGCGKTGCLETETSLLVVIEKATEKLIESMNRLCPHCQMPGFDISDVKEGLPCSQCGSATRSTLAWVYQCQKCKYQQEVKFPKGKSQEDPMYCDWCNP